MSNYVYEEKIVKPVFKFYKLDVAEEVELFKNQEGYYSLSDITFTGSPTKAIEFSAVIVFFDLYNLSDLNKEDVKNSQLNIKLMADSSSQELTIEGEELLPGENNVRSFTSELFRNATSLTFTMSGVFNMVVAEFK